MADQSHVHVSGSVDEETVTQYILDSFDAVETVTAGGATFFFCDPEQKFAFATLVTQDNDYDNVSNLNRPCVFRLNIGVSKETYERLLGPRPSRPGEIGIVDTGHDFSALDQILPHPTYAFMGWLCVLNPSPATFEKVKSLLAEAYDRDRRKYAKRIDRK